MNYTYGKKGGGNTNTLNELMIIAVIHNCIARQWVLDVIFIKDLSLTTGKVMIINKLRAKFSFFMSAAHQT